MPGLGQDGRLDPTIGKARPPVPPGIVRYAPDDGKSAALAAFAGDLTRRGWRIGGIVIETLWDEGRAGVKQGLDLVDLATGNRIPLARPGMTGIRIGRWVLDPLALDRAVAAIRRAVSGGVDLVIVDKFGPLEGRGEGLATVLRAALESGLPCLIAVRDEFVDAWNTFWPYESVSLNACPEDFWRWWGPRHLLRDLRYGVGEQRVDRVVIGLNWTLVAGPEGAGLAHSPVRDTPGCRAVKQAGSLTGHTLRELAGLVDSDNPAEVAIGVAAINAAFNHGGVEGGSENGLDVFRSVADRTVAIGRFPDLADRLPGVRVIERVPRDGEFPESAAADLLADCEAVVITASTLSNGSLPRLLTLGWGRRIALVGPGTPLTPRLHAFGVEILAGQVITDIDGAARVIAEGGAVKALRPYMRSVTVRRS